MATMKETPSDTRSPVRQNGVAIRALREKDGWTQTALAEAVGIRQPTLSAIESETANTPMTTLNIIARNLSVPVAAIMRAHPEPLRQPEPAGDPEEDSEPEPVAA